MVNPVGIRGRQSVRDRKSCRHMVGGVHVSINPLDIRGGRSECDNYFTFADTACPQRSFVP